MNVFALGALDDVPVLELVVAAVIDPLVAVLNAELALELWSPPSPG